MSQFIGWPTEGVEYWNAFWRGKAAEGFFNDICYCGEDACEICPEGTRL